MDRMANGWLASTTHIRSSGRQVPTKSTGNEPIPEYARPIIDRGPRPLYEMEQVLPGDDPDDPDGDPIIQSNDSKDRSDFAGAQMRYRAWADCNRTKPWRCWKKADLNLLRSLRSQDLLLHFAQPVLAEEELVPDVETRRAERAARHRALGGVEQLLLHAGVSR